MRPVGVGSPRPRGRSQAELVSVWLGTYELLLNDTIRFVVIGDRREVIQTPSPDVLAAAATAILGMLDFDQPVFTGHGHNMGEDWIDARHPR